MSKDISDIKNISDLKGTLHSPHPVKNPIDTPAPTTELKTTEIPEISEPKTVQDFARAKGHISKDEWVKQGRNPDLYIDEDTWVKNYTWLTQIKELKKQSAEQKEALEYLVEQNKKALEAGEKMGREKLLEELHKQQIDAIASGDPARITAATEKLVMEKNKDKLPHAATQTDIAAETDAFLKRNADWFNGDTPINLAAKNYAIARENEIAISNPSLPLDKRLKQVEDEVKQHFLTKPSMIAAASVATSTESPAPKVELNLDGLDDFHKNMIKKLQKSVRNFDVKAYIQRVQDVNNAFSNKDITMR